MTTLNDTFTGGNEAEAAIDAEVKAMFDSIDPGTLATNEDEIALDRYMRLRSHMNDEMNRLAEQFKSMLRTLTVRMDRLDYQFRPIAERIVAAKLAGKRCKTLDRPWGKVGFRTIPETIEIKDSEAVLQAVIAGKLPDDCQRVSIEPSKQALIDYFKANGAVPDGCEFVPSHERFFVK